jgi:hypothetical protein
VELKVSRPIQILLFVLVIAGVGGIASMQMLGKGSSSGGAALTPDQVRARAHHTSVQALHTAKPAATKPPVVATKPGTTRTPKPAVTKPKPPANGLPIVLNDLFRQHRIVVVSIFDPQDKTDAISYAEARAGAADAGAGFLGVSVLDDSVAGPLTAALPDQGLLPVPGVLIYRRPGVLIQRVDGFQDRGGVAQLAAGAVTAPPLAASSTATAAVAAPVAAVPTAAPTTTTP